VNQEGVEVTARFALVGEPEVHRTVLDVS